MSTSIGVLERFQRAVQDDPHALAVVDGEVALTRSELSLRAAALATSLARHGVGRGDRVGVCVERSAALITAVLGVVLSGAAYVAIDPAYPDERISWMLEDCGAAALVLGAGRAVSGHSGATALDGADASASDATPTLSLSRDGRLTTSAADVPATAPEDRAGAAPGLSEPAYVVYTSGSTGQPKGVTIDHGGLANLVDWHCRAFGLRDTDRASQIASPGFDAAVWEIWPPLSTGATLHIVPEPLKTDPFGLRDWLVAQRITVGFVPTALAETLITLDWPEATALRHMLAGGDALTRRPRPDLPFTLVNNYGVSEAAVVATSGRVDPAGDGAPSIGWPIDGVLAEIVDADGTPVPAGEDGELVLGGVAVGLGYLNRPELTRERFSTDARGRWYRTGDRMRFSASGELEFLGRLDDQLSIRGFRIEPAEIAAALNAHPAVSASVAVASAGASAEARLIAYVVAADGIRPGDAELTAFLAPRLPGHMHPSAYVWLEALPMTAHGKVDRPALPAPEATAGATAEAAEAAETADGESELEAAIAAIVAELLGVPAIGVNDNFFLRGGHSMLGAQLIVRLDELYDVEVPLRYLFDHPTAAELAVEVAAQRAEAGATVAG
jgi:amino acid adenylation domain-containing protein